jgi:hypothetical protein
MTTDPSSSRRFAIALSFPGEHRDSVKQIADHLAAAFGKERVLYDKYYEAEFARPDLDIYLPGLYRTQSALIALFLCPQYAAKRWCNLEWRHIRQLIATEDASRIMLLRYGYDGDLAALGILPGDGVINCEGRPAQEIADRIRERFFINQGFQGFQGFTPTPSSRFEAESQATQKSPASGALVIWQRKLAFFFEEQAKVVDPDQKFRLVILIEEARAQIREHGGHA